MRSQARENAFKLVFESLFHDVDNQLSSENLIVLKKDEDQKFFEDIMKSFEDHKEELKQKIEENLKNFAYSRVFKIDLALIYVALSEILYLGTPKGVAINEALELSKEYSTEKSSKFINGIISAITKE